MMLSHWQELARLFAGLQVANQGFSSTLYFARFAPLVSECSTEWGAGVEDSGRGGWVKTLVKQRMLRSSSEVHQKLIYDL